MRNKWQIITLTKNLTQYLIVYTGISLESFDMTTGDMCYCCESFDHRPLSNHDRTSLALSQNAGHHIPPTLHP